MKTQKNSKLEKILNSTKDAVKTAVKRTVDFCKDNARVGVMIGAGMIETRDSHLF